MCAAEIGVASSKAADLLRGGCASRHISGALCGHRCLAATAVVRRKTQGRTASCKKNLELEVGAPLPLCVAAANAMRQACLTLDTTTCVTSLFNSGHQYGPESFVECWYNSGLACLLNLDPPHLWRHLQGRIQGGVFLGARIAPHCKDVAAASL